MSLGVEHNLFIGTPVPQGVERPDEDARFAFRELSGDRIEVRHPFHGTTVLGDGSTFADPSLDAAAVVLFKHMPFLVDSAKLNRPRKYETRPFAGEYAQLSHCFSLGVLSVELGGGPMDVLDALYNDASHVYNGHQGDDNYQGHGHEDLHDKDRSQFFEHAGIIDALIEAGALRRNRSEIYVGRTRLTIDRLLSEDEVTVRRSFLSNKHKARRMDADRFQYVSEESLLVRWAANNDMPDPGRVPRALAEASLNAITRRIVTDDGEGDQLAYTDDHVALTDAREYTRHNAEHWCEPVQDLLNDILNLTERYFFLCNHPYARNFQYFYPRDYLHTSASLMFEHFDEVAKDDPVMDWLLRTAERIAIDQRSKSLSNLQGRSSYAGPSPPDGIKLSRVDAINNEALFGIVGDKFVIQLPKGKVRTINPRVTNGGGITKPLSELRPEFINFSLDSQRWIGDYVAEVDIDSQALLPELISALDRIKNEWDSQLRLRPHMPPQEMQRTISEANAYVRSRGKRPMIASQ